MPTRYLALAGRGVTELPYCDTLWWVMNVGAYTLGGAVQQHRQTLAGSTGGASHRGSSSRQGSAAPSCAEAAAHALQRPPAKQRSTSGPAPC